MVRRRAVEGNRVDYGRGDGFSEWYLNGPQGIEQFVGLAERPAPGTDGPPIIEIDVDGPFEPDAVNEDTVVLESREENAQLIYRNLFIRDAEGESVPARMEVREGRIRLVVEDDGARYPLQIDPTFGTQKVITTDTDGAESVYAADLDGDGTADCNEIADTGPDTGMPDVGGTSDAGETRAGETRLVADTTGASDDVTSAGSSGHLFSSGCGCRASHGPPSGWPTSLLFGLVGLGLRRRRRKSRWSCSYGGCACSNGPSVRILVPPRRTSIDSE